MCLVARVIAGWVDVLLLRAPRKPGTMMDEHGSPPILVTLAACAGGAAVNDPMTTAASSLPPPGIIRGGTGLEPPMVNPFCTGKALVASARRAVLPCIHMPYCGAISSAVRNGAVKVCRVRRWR